MGLLNHGIALKGRMNRRIAEAPQRGFLGLSVAQRLRGQALSGVVGTDPFWRAAIRVSGGLSPGHPRPLPRSSALADLVRRKRSRADAVRTNDEAPRALA